MSKTRRSRWYFGGLASCGAACCTHPLDLLKVHLQTQQEVKMRMTGMAIHVVRNDGFLALYNGLSASLFRQVKLHTCTPTGRGFTGGFVGTPADMVNVRMQNDMKLPAPVRRNYKHAVDGLYRVLQEEGIKKLFSGATMASTRGALVTVGQ
ncbi:hypothetical protein chiPu_0018955, partial [Chiloscyllium punctatum]|nr:hypothetical protein [Chiloscyllium punctatum]